MKKTALTFALSFLIVLPSAFAQFHDRQNERRDDRLEWQVRSKIERLYYLAQGRAIERVAVRDLMFLDGQLNQAIYLLEQADNNYPHPGPGPGPMPGPIPHPGPHR